MQPGAAGPAGEFSRIVNLNDLLPEGSWFEISADEAERAALAKRFGLAALESLDATVRLMPHSDGAVRFAARVTARLSQICVVTLEPVAEEIDTEVAITFRPRLAGAEDKEIVLDVEEDNEPLTGDSLDIGEIVAEELALSLNPYPRAPGAGIALGPEISREGADDERPGPFSALAALRRKGIEK